MFIEAPVETVWSTLGATDKSPPFFFGAMMRMVYPSGKITMVVGEVLNFDPPTCYAHTLQLTGIDEPSCVVTYALAKKIAVQNSG